MQQLYGNDSIRMKYIQKYLITKQNGTNGRGQRFNSWGKQILRGQNIYLKF